MNIKELYAFFMESTGICTDTRRIREGNLFIALKGDNFNGNKFADQAKKNGALACIVDEAEYENTQQHIFLVEDGLETLQALATYHRQQLKIPVIGLTGSNGKTTTKELIATCLEHNYKVAYTQGNLNNHIGVPLTLLEIDSSHEIAVVEMGANHLGEIADLCEIAQPDYGYITNFGKAHLEGFGSEEGVIQGKSELYAYLEKSGGTAFVNADDRIQMKKTANLHRISFGFNNDSDYNFERSSKHGIASVKYKNSTFATNLSGNYNEPNIAAAATIALHFEVTTEVIQQSLQDYYPKLNRSQEIEKNGKRILLDAYNANPTSMEAALRNFASLDGSKTVILGDMFELGETSAQEHQAIADLAIELGFEQVYLIGKHFYQINPATSIAKVFEDREKFVSELNAHPIHTDRILIKGSRGMALERLIDLIKF